MYMHYLDSGLKNAHETDILIRNFTGRNLAACHMLHERGLQLHVLSQFFSQSLKVAFYCQLDSWTK